VVRLEVALGPERRCGSRSWGAGSGS